MTTDPPDLLREEKGQGLSQTCKIRQIRWTPLATQNNLPASGQDLGAFICIPHRQAGVKATCRKKSAVQSTFLHVLISASLYCSLHFVVRPTAPLRTIRHIWENMGNAYSKAPVLNTACKIKPKEWGFCKWNNQIAHCCLRAGPSPGHALLLPTWCWLWHWTDYRNPFTLTQQRTSSVEWGFFDSLVSWFS